MQNEETKLKSRADIESIERRLAEKGIIVDLTEVNAAEVAELFDKGFSADDIAIYFAETHRLEHSLTLGGYPVAMPRVGLAKRGESEDERLSRRVMESISELGTGSLCDGAIAFRITYGSIQSTHKTQDFTVTLCNKVERVEVFSARKEIIGDDLDSETLFKTPNVFRRGRWMEILFSAARQHREERLAKEAVVAAQLEKRRLEKEAEQARIEAQKFAPIDDAWLDELPVNQSFRELPF